MMTMAAMSMQMPKKKSVPIDEPITTAIEIPGDQDMIKIEQELLGLRYVLCGLHAYEQHLKYFHCKTNAYPCKK